MFEQAGNLEGSPLAKGERFCFACRPDLACFNSCCANKRLPLLPYDMLRLRRGLQKSSPEILASLVTLEMDPVSGWPALRLALTDQGLCPLVGPQGCGVYEHRPSCCRIYPLARANARPNASGASREVFLKPTENPACLGWNQPRELGISQWVTDQGLAEYFAAHDRLLNLFMHPAKTGRLKLNEAQTHAVILALYNLDVFRQAAGQKGFAEKAGLNPAETRAANESDELLLALGEKWLASLFFGSGR